MPRARTPLITTTTAWNRFALLGDRLLVVSTTRVSVLADDGSEVYAHEVKLDSPAIALGGGTAAVYDVGGTTLYILGEGALCAT